jgi:hypothetical protein
MPRPVIGSHARKRMAKRHINEDQIFTALRREQRRTPGDPGTIWIHGIVDGGRILKVCVTVDMGLVTTVAWPDE